MPAAAPIADAPAWLTACRDHLPRAHAVAQRLLGCSHLADDALQEALLALARLPAAPADPHGWLVRAITLRARHLRRSLRRRHHHEHHAGTAHCERHGDCDNPLHTAHAHELGERLTAALDALPKDQRTVFELFEHQGLDYPAIAAQLAVPIGTVRSRLHRARSALQRAVGDRGAAPAAPPRTTAV
jgi:RNA polymerase sigma factor (sigma-70 family)